jgi:hypothetical protein
LLFKNNKLFFSVIIRYLLHYSGILILEAPRASSVKFSLAISTNICHGKGVRNHPTILIPIIPKKPLMMNTVFGTKRQTKREDWGKRSPSECRTDQNAQYLLLTETKKRYIIVKKKTKYCPM